jgi:hypothetical protein
MAESHITRRKRILRFLQTKLKFCCLTCWEERPKFHQLLSFYRLEVLQLTGRKKVIGDMQIECSDYLCHLRLQMVLVLFSPARLSASVNWGTAVPMAPDVEQSGLGATF